MWLTIKHLVDLLVRTVEHNTSALRDTSQADGVIQESEAARFIKSRQAGKELEMRNSLAGADWRLAQDKAFFTAAALKIQLASRARKARRKVEERRRKNMEMQQALEGGEEQAAALAEERAAPPAADEVGRAAVE